MKTAEELYLLHVRGVITNRENLLGLSNASEVDPDHIPHPLFAQLTEAEPLPSDASPVSISMLKAMRNAASELYDARRKQLEIDEHFRKLGLRLPVHYDSSPILTADEEVFFNQWRSDGSIPWSKIAESIFGTTYRGTVKRTKRFLAVLDGREDFGVALKDADGQKLPFWTAVAAWRAYHAYLKANIESRGKTGRAALTRAARIKSLRRR